MTTPTKHCKRCATDKSTEEFYKDRRRADGRTPWCIECIKAYINTPEQREKRRAYSARYAEEHKEQIRDYHRRRYEENKERLREQSRVAMAALRAKDPERVREYQRRWSQANREKINERARARAKAKREAQS